MTSSSEPSSRRRLTVLGHGRATIAAGEATLGLGVELVRPTAGDAVATAAAAMTRVIEALRSAGVGGDLRTVGLSVVADVEYGPDGRPRQTGFRVTNRLAVPVPAVEEAGRLVDVAVAAGATRVDGIEFAASDPGAARRAALEGAMADARAAAEALAAAAGAALGDVLGIRELEPGRRPGPDVAMLEARAAETPLLPGAGTVEAVVEVSWRLRAGG